MATLKRLASMKIWNLNAAASFVFICRPVVVAWAALSEHRSPVKENLDTTPEAQGQTREIIPQPEKYPDLKPLIVFLTLLGLALATALAAAQPVVTVYSAPWCPACQVQKHSLVAAGIPFVEVQATSGLIPVVVVGQYANSCRGRRRGANPRATGTQVWRLRHSRDTRATDAASGTSGRTQGGTPRLRRAGGVPAVAITAVEAITKQEDLAGSSPGLRRPFSSSS